MIKQAVAKKNLWQMPARWLAATIVAMAMLLVASQSFAKSAPESFADLAEKLLPAVVNVSTTQVIEGRSGPEMPQLPPGSPFEDFFKEFNDRNGKQGHPRSRKATSLGSGFIIDTKSNGDSFVVTNNHVIQSL